jgi:hypothetical protein
MFDTFRPISGWYVRHPHFLSEPPVVREDLVRSAEPEAALDPSDVYSTFEEALAVAVDQLTTMRDQALEDLEFWSKPYRTANGSILLCRPETVRQARQEAASRHRIAAEGLALCGVRK